MAIGVLNSHIFKVATFFNFIDKRKLVALNKFGKEE